MRYSKIHELERQPGRYVRSCNRNQLNRKRLIWIRMLVISMVIPLFLVQQKTVQAAGYMVSQPVGNAGFSAGLADYTSIALDNSDAPYVVYTDYGYSYKATVMKLAPLPKYTVRAAAASMTSGVGTDHEITLTVKDSKGFKDTTFTGAHDVTISGYLAAPNGSYGSFNGTDLTGGPNTISVTFTSGEAKVNLRLNKAAAQTIGYSVAGVVTPVTNTVSITPIAGSAASMALTTDVAAPASHGGGFAQ